MKRLDCHKEVRILVSLHCTRKRDAIRLLSLFFFLHLNQYRMVD